MKKHINKIILFVIFIISVGIFDEIIKLSEQKRIDEVQDYLLTKSYISREEQNFFNDVDLMLQEGLDSNFCKNKRNKFLPLFYSIYDISQPSQEMEMFFDNDCVVIRIDLGNNPLNYTIKIAYKADIEGNVVKTGSFKVKNKFYTVRNNMNMNILHFQGRDDLFN